MVVRTQSVTGLQHDWRQKSGKQAMHAAEVDHAAWAG